MWALRPGGILSHEHATHGSTTDPDARLARKSNHGAAWLNDQASVLMDNRPGLIVATQVTQPGYTAECDAALELLTTLGPRARRRTPGADKGYDQPAPCNLVRMRTLLARDACA